MSFTKEQSSVGAHCPFCGDERNIVEIGVPFDDGICHVECARCGAHGPVESAEDRAISAWNLRAGGPVERPALNTKQFSREELETLVCLSAFESNPVVRLAQVAAFALAQMERAEKAEADLSVSESASRMYADRALRAEDRQRVAEAERDRLKGELEEAEEAIRYFATKVDLARPAKFHPIDTRRTVIFSCKADGTWNHDPACSSAVRRAMERGK